MVSSNPNSYQLNGPSPGEYVYVSVNITNECGSSLQFGQSVYGASEIDGQPCQAYRRAPDAAPKAYPNPADTELTVELPDNVEGHVRLYNGQGRQVRQAAARGKQVRFDVRGLPEGLYQLHVPTANGVSQQQQIQIKH
ncbi:T9SS type A sorting domain-containing protein [Hymenobacter weizhouensis]|uniref:T9SS type A sorting domain-containing protein n=1 Tax=Hymenobacter sp. YIM 151500-1 TaxID=2987689 RepID=UPI002227ACD1|nr:T9SS type A sorting domain-containing protein [Hymenobacter sp. YIM 151500-1]UYZ61960.1 T9SS type A sorting domain-containing protein [Hymenobacter sp. YIM 151500-1]